MSTLVDPVVDVDRQSEAVATVDLAAADAPPAWIYEGTIRHRRYEPTRHDFSYRLFELLLDVDRLPEAFAGCRLWSHERANVASFRRRDYLGDPARPLRDAVADEVEALGGARPRGRIWMLTHPRYLGYCFNPVTFYYCLAPDGRLDAVLAEITNTPWLERHRYLVCAGDARDGAGVRQGDTLRRVFEKSFHVSPFFEMDHGYDWRFTKPGGTLAVHMENRRGGAGRDERLVFDATLTMRARAWNARERALALLRYPAMTAKVWLGIHWQALRLWQKKVPTKPHPRRETER